MTCIYILCEGQTEEVFIKEVLSLELKPLNIYLTPCQVGNPGRKGGDVSYSKVLRDIKKLLNNKTAYCSTLFDFYGLPHNFPGKKEALLERTIQNKQKKLLEIFHRKLNEDLGDEACKRFIPYIQMYEFEGLLFSSPLDIVSEINKDNLLNSFQKIRNEFDTPEEINNSTSSAPSKRIIKLFNEYEKVTHGSLIALKIGIHKICEECHLFNEWFQKLKTCSPLT